MRGRHASIDTAVYRAVVRFNRAGSHREMGAQEVRGREGELPDDDDYDVDLLTRH